MVRQLPGRDAMGDADRQRHQIARLHLLFEVIRPQARPVTARKRASFRDKV